MNKQNNDFKCESCIQFGKGTCNAFKCIARNYSDWKNIVKPIHSVSILGKSIDYASKLSLYGCISEQHAKDINEIIKGIIEDNKNKMINQIEKYCVDYMADANHNLEYNKPTPPIWEYLKDKLK